MQPLFIAVIYVTIRFFLPRKKISFFLMHRKKNSFLLLCFFQGVGLILNLTSCATRSYLTSLVLIVVFHREADSEARNLTSYPLGKLTSQAFHSYVGFRLVVSVCGGAGVRNKYSSPRMANSAPLG